MRRLADLPQPWRFVVYAVIALAMLAMLRWVDRDLPPAGNTTTIHVRYRHAHAGRHVFTHVPAGADDVRTRWLRVDVSSSRAQQALADLARDPDVDEAFVVP